MESYITLSQDLETVYIDKVKLDGRITNISLKKLVVNLDTFTKVLSITKEISDIKCLVLFMS